MTTNDALGTRKIEPKIIMEKAALIKKEDFSLNVGLQGRNFILFILFSTVHFP